MSHPTVLAAGGVLWREDDSGPQVALVHRPKYDDWSLPKGKAKAGEHLLVTALREVTEETGHNPRLGPYLMTLRYRVSSAGHRSKKSVAYWAMRCDGGAFRVSKEVDQMTWLPLAEAHDRVTSGSDRAVLDTFGRTRRDTELLLLVRHGETVAPSRRTRERPEEQRLNRSGRDRATSLVPILGGLGITDLLSADLAACVDTLTPFATATGLTVRRETQLTRAGFAGNETEAADRVRREASAGQALVVCGGQQVITGLLSSLGHGSYLRAPRETTVMKGGWWLLHHCHGAVIAYERHQPAG